MSRLSRLSSSVELSMCRYSRKKDLFFHHRRMSTVVFGASTAVFSAQFFDSYRGLRTARTTSSPSLATEKAHPTVADGDEASRCPQSPLGAHHLHTPHNMTHMYPQHIHSTSPIACPTHSCIAHATPSDLTVTMTATHNLSPTSRRMIDTELAPTRPKCPTRRVSDGPLHAMIDPFADCASGHRPSTSRTWQPRRGEVLAPLPSTSRRPSTRRKTRCMDSSSCATKGTRTHT